MLMSALGVRHADIGIAKTMTDRTIETNCDVLRNISILPRPANFMRQSPLSLLRSLVPALEQAAFSQVTSPVV